MSEPDLSVDDSENLSIGERIRLARKHAGLNQTALAIRVGVSQPAVANWEAGVHDPRRLMIAKISSALGVSPNWLAGGRRSTTELDKHPAAAYIRRPVQHTPVVSLSNAMRIYEDPDIDPHSFAEDYIPVTIGAPRVFAFFADDPAMDLAFPRNTLVVIDFADRRPADGGYVLACTDDLPILRQWRTEPNRLEPCSSQPHDTIYLKEPPHIIGCARVSIRIH